MGTALAITRTDHTAAELRGFARRSTDGEQIRRLLALAVVLDGHPRTEAAEQTGMERQTLRDWVHRYNEGGVDALKSRRSPGPTPALTAEQMAELKALVVQGPDPAVDNVVRWRCVDLRQKVADRFNVDVHQSTIGKWLRRFGMTRLQPRPFHPKKDAAAEAAFKKRARIGGPPVAVETDCAILSPGGAAEKFLVDLTPSKNLAHGPLRTCEW
jgi:transposase